MMTNAAKAAGLSLREEKAFRKEELRSSRVLLRTGSLGRTSMILHPWTGAQ